MHLICLLWLQMFDISNLIGHEKRLPFNWVLRSSLVLALPILMFHLYSGTLNNDESGTIYYHETETLEEKNINLTALWPHHEPLSTAAARRLSTLAANGLQLRVPHPPASQWPPPWVSLLKDSFCQPCVRIRRCSPLFCTTPSSRPSSRRSSLLSCSWSPDFASSIQSQ